MKLRLARVARHGAARTASTLGLLVLGAATVPPGQAAPKAPPPPAYVAACQSCHKADGSGVPGVFPRIAGRMGSAAQSAAGRKWMIANLIFGQSGAIEVDGKPIRGIMPAFARLSDAQIAEVLNWISAGQGKPFTAGEVASVRAQPGMNPAKVGQMRAELAKAGVIK
ncbi:c-type cytochrome [Novosphingobium sp. M1R2S20]|uniref:Cytochrome c n=1 Tax=Novosphingobium rhizovicinum TaxID=3228928 RepID=A0ABV3REG8_9SPHN